MRIRRVAELIVLLIFLGHVTPVYGDDLDRELRTADARLQRPVTISAPHVYLGELLEQITKQTGVSIGIDENDTASGTELTVSCDHVPAGDVLNALWSLLSSRDIPWRWTRSRYQSAYTYQLTEPADAKARGEWARSLLKQEFENYVVTMLEFAFATPEERERNRRRITEVLHQNDDTKAEALVQSEGTWDMIKLCALAVPHDLLARVLRGEAQADIPMDSLSDEAKRLFSKLEGSLDPHMGLNGVPLPFHLDSLKFSTRTNTDVGDYTPTVFIDEGQFGSFSLMGSYYFADGIRNLLKSLWILREDNTGDPRVLARTVVSGIDLQNMQAARRQSYLSLRLMQLAQGAGLPMIALVSHASDSDPRFPGGKTVQDWLDGSSEGSLMPMYKWRGNVLLASYPAWFLKDESAAPYALIKRYLRGSEQIIPLLALTKLMAALDDDQAQELASVHPAIEAALEIRPVFVLYNRYPSLLSSQGAALNSDIIAMLRSLPFNKHIDDHSLALRLTQEDHSTSDRQIVLIRIEIQGSDSRWSLLGGFAQSVPRTK